MRVGFFSRLKQDNCHFIYLRIHVSLYHANAKFSLVCGKWSSIIYKYDIYKSYFIFQMMTSFTY